MATSTGTSVRSFVPPDPMSVTAADHSMLAAFVAFLRRRWALMVTWGLAGMLLVAAVTLAGPRTYSAKATFLPTSQRSGASRLEGLAAQLGVRAGGSGEGDSPAFYADLLRSEELLRAVAMSPYPSERGKGVTVDLVTALDVPGESPPERVENAVTALRQRIVAVGINRETSVLTLRVTTTSAELSRAISERLIQLLGEFNLNRRQTQAKTERAFVEARLDEARGELSRAEELLRAFHQQNRAYQASPDLRLREERLARDVLMRQELVTNLAQSYNEARIEEVRNTPVITVIEPPRAPVHSNSRYLLARAVIGFVVGAALFAVFDWLRTQVRMAASVPAAA